MAMFYIFAAIGAITVAVLLWRLLAAQQQIGAGTRSREPVAPDDDPEFLRKLSEQQRKRRREED